MPNKNIHAPLHEYLPKQVGNKFPNTQQLLLQTASGDEQAFAQLIHLHWRNIYLHALTYTRSAPKAEELTQDIFLIVWNNKEKLSTIEDFSAWLHVVARNKILSALRTKVQEIAAGNNIDTLAEENLQMSLSPEQQLESREAYKLLLQAIELLPEKRRNIFKLSRMEGLSNLEIAERLQIHPVTVAQYLAKALTFLKTYLHENRINTILAIIILGGFSGKMPGA